MNTPYKIYSPAPPTTRLHALNIIFGKMLANAGIDNEVIPVPLPDSINQIADLPTGERIYHLPIITPIDMIPAVQKTGADWHAYSRKNIDLKFVASLYDVGFGIMAFSSDINGPNDLRGKRIAVPARPSSVRIYTEALLFQGWGLEGEVELIDMPPPAVLNAVESGAIDATSWNITTIEGDDPVPQYPWAADRPNAHWIDVDAAATKKINDAHDFVIEQTNLGAASLLSFRLGLMVWQETPDDFVKQIVDVLKGSSDGRIFSKQSDIHHWPGITDAMRHSAVRLNR